jgi:hypothetical protein
LDRFLAFCRDIFSLRLKNAIDRELTFFWSLERKEGAMKLERIDSESKHLE